MTVKEKYSQLPETLTPDEARGHFLELLAIPLPKTEEAIDDHVEAMSKVADRQWHTYTVLDARTRDKLDAWVSTVWNRHALKRARLLIGIIARVGLVRSMRFLQQELRKDLHPLVRIETMEAIKEFGATVGDPYSGMRGGGSQA